MYCIWAIVCHPNLIPLGLPVKPELSGISFPISRASGTFYSGFITGFSRFIFKKWCEL
jgi:hypothetical protein